MAEIIKCNFSLLRWLSSLNIVFECLFLVLIELALLFVQTQFSLFYIIFTLQVDHDDAGLHFI